MSIKRLSRTIVAADTLDELLNYQAEREAEANARIAPWQAAIQRGDCLRYTFEHAPDLVVYAEVQRARRGQPYIFVRGYSTVVPKGERGDIHRSVVTAVISREAFEAARRQGWGHDHGDCAPLG